MPDFDFIQSQDSLDALLDRLLHMEAERIVGHVGVVKKLCEDRLVACGLALEKRRQLTRVRIRQRRVPRVAPDEAACP
jgi:hypothetical protein